MSTRGFWIDHFPGNFLWSNAALACKGMAPYGVVAMDEIDRIAEKLKTRQGEPQAWQEEWCAMAAQGHDRTAGNYYLRAGNYYYTGERFIPPGKAAYDYVAQRADVDPARVVIMGYSFGGYYSARIAAFEPRYAAGVAMTALHWDLAGWQQRIKEKAQAEGSKVAQSNFQFQWVVGAADADGGIEIAKKFSLQDVAQRITMPFPVTHGANDRVVPAENAQKLFDAIGSTRKTLRVFTAGDGGAEHAHVDNRQVGVDFVADWIAANLPG